MDTARRASSRVMTSYPAGAKRPDFTGLACTASSRAQEIASDVRKVRQMEGDLMER